MAIRRPPEEIERLVETEISPTQADWLCNLLLINGASTMKFFHACLAVTLLLAGSARAASSSVTYTYDSQGRLVQAVYVSGSVTRTVTYNLDVMGNRTSVVTQ